MFVRFLLLRRLLPDMMCFEGFTAAFRANPSHLPRILHMCQECLNFCHEWVLARDAIVPLVLADCSPDCSSDFRILARRAIHKTIYTNSVFSLFFFDRVCFQTEYIARNASPVFFRVSFGCNTCFGDSCEFWRFHAFLAFFTSLGGACCFPFFMDQPITERVFMTSTAISLPTCVLTRCGDVCWNSAALFTHAFFSYFWVGCKWLCTSWTSIIGTLSCFYCALCFETVASWQDCVELQHNKKLKGNARKKNGEKTIKKTKKKKKTKNKKCKRMKKTTTLDPEGRTPPFRRLTGVLCVEVVLCVSLWLSCAVLCWWGWWCVCVCGCCFFSLFFC